MILYEELSLGRRGFCFSSGLFFSRTAQKYCEVEMRSASFSVLLTDLHGVLTEATVAAANHVTFRLIRSLAPRSGRGRCLE